VGASEDFGEVVAAN